ncbi:MAG TPA: DUF4142 domain-containing protein [Longimicrobiales bacterium]
MDQSTSRAAVRAFPRFVAAAALGLAACGPSEREVRVQPAPGESYVLTDVEISSIMMNANNGEIQAGQLALQKSRNDAVRQFAQRMITEHTTLNQMISPHMDRRNRTDMRDGMGARGPISQQLSSNNQRTLHVLQQLEGAQFDRTYMQNQVAQHEWLLNTLDDALIPGADDNALERDLREARDMVASHLQQARQIRGSMGR